MRVMFVMLPSCLCAAGLVRVMFVMLPSCLCAAGLVRAMFVMLPVMSLCCRPGEGHVCHVTRHVFVLQAW